MAYARLVVVYGPDVGTVFPIPMRGGSIGRGEENLVQLRDPSVSREHCTIEFRDQRLTLLDQSSRNRTLVNGELISKHPLTTGDEITVGQTRMTFVQEEVQDAAQPLRPSRVTIEVGSSALILRAAQKPLEQHRHLSALAAFGDKLHVVQSEAELGRAACEAIVTALGADRAFLLLHDKGRMLPKAASVRPGDPAGQQVQVPSDLIAKVATEGKCVAAEGVETAAGARAVLSAPLLASPSEAPLGLLYADRQAGSWQEMDLMAMSCLAHLFSAALANQRSRDSLKAENQHLSEELGKGAFVGESPPALQLMSFVHKVGPSDATVLVTGQSGSGKEMVARGIHQASRRSGQSFVAVNCAALTESLIESELFGHEKGAFTGATERKIGRFEAANNGTLFLDEVGELPLSCQTKFLRVLEEQCFERVGGTRSIHVNVRVVAATNRDLPAMVQSGGFREDLYYRLSVIHTRVPALHERPSDVPILAHHFLHRLRNQVARRIEGFSQDAMQGLCNYDWPGNVRELRNAIERAIVLGEGPHILLGDLPPELARPHARTERFTPMTPTPTAPAMPIPEAPYVAVSAAHAGLHAASPQGTGASARPLRELEREGIVAALRETGGNKAKAAAILEIDRSTLYKKLKDYDIEG